MDRGAEIPAEHWASVIEMCYDSLQCGPRGLAYDQLTRDEKVVDLDDYELVVPAKSKGLNIRDLIRIFSKK